MVKRFHALHKTVILLTVTSENVPYYCDESSDERRVDVEDLGQGFYRVLVRYGFMEMPNIPKVMEKAFQKTRTLLLGARYLVCLRARNVC